MPVSGLVIQVDPARRNAIISTLNNLDNVELTDTPDGKPLVAVLDVESMREEEALFKEINDISGVHNVSLSYHNFEDISDDQNT
ncbi:chaperone NapD [Deltaproteobacteria bacterium IMCC39524]|nr:chaperone NapD [Deltaproteobacteria bacterium IMCC39524]